MNIYKGCKKLIFRSVWDLMGFQELGLLVLPSTSVSVLLRSSRIDSSCWVSCLCLIVKSLCKFSFYRYYKIKFIIIIIINVCLLDCLCILSFSRIVLILFHTD